MTRVAALMVCVMMLCATVNIHIRGGVLRVGLCFGGGLCVQATGSGLQMRRAHRPQNRRVTRVLGALGWQGLGFLRRAAPGGAQLNRALARASGVGGSPDFGNARAPTVD